MQGVPSVLFPAREWGGHLHWGRAREYRFEDIAGLAATAERREDKGHVMDELSMLALHQEEEEGDEDDEEDGARGRGTSDMDDT